MFSIFLPDMGYQPQTFQLTTRNCLFLFYYFPNKYVRCFITYLLLHKLQRRVINIIKYTQYGKSYIRPCRTIVMLVHMKLKKFKQTKALLWLFSGKNVADIWRSSRITCSGVTTCSPTFSTDTLLKLERVMSSD